MYYYYSVNSNNFLQLIEYKIISKKLKRLQPYKLQSFDKYPMTRLALLIEIIACIQL